MFFTLLQNDDKKVTMTVFFIKSKSTAKNESGRY